MIAKHLRLWRPKTSCQRKS